MQNIKKHHFFSLLLLSFFFFSCEDVIELDLENESPRLIIEAYVDISSQSAKAIISQSNGFYESTDLIRISDGLVKLQTADKEYTLLETEAGIYEVGNIVTSPDERLTLTVDVDGQTYIAETDVPHKVSLDTIEKNPFNAPFGINSDEQTYQVIASWMDKANVENYYRLRPFIDDKQANVYTLTNDRGIDGRAITQPIRDFFEEGKTVELELLSVSKSYYEYFIQLSAIQGQGAESGNPFNPIGNFDDEDVLGYFGAYTVSRQQIEL